MHDHEAPILSARDSREQCMLLILYIYISFIKISYYYSIVIRKKMNNLLKLSVWLAVVSAAHTEETSSSSSFASTIKTLLRGGDGEYLTTQKTNPCATRARPENCKWII